MRRVGRGGGDTEEEKEEELPESPNIRHLYHYFLSYLHCIINEKNFCCSAYRYLVSCGMILFRSKFCILSLMWFC